MPAPGGARAQRWDLEALPASSHFLEYIPGRDTLFDASALAAGALACGCVFSLLVHCWGSVCIRMSMQQPMALYVCSMLPCCNRGTLFLERLAPVLA